MRSFLLPLLLVRSERSYLALPALRSEHAVGIRTRKVRRDHRSGVLRRAHELQRIPVLDGFPLSVHAIDIDASNAGVVGIIGEQVEEVQMRPHVVADRNNPMNDNARPGLLARDLGEELPERYG